MKYEPLLRFLRARPDSTSIRLSFAEIDAILGFPLPRSARHHQAWWSNTRLGHSHAAAWLNAGWKTEMLDLAGERVTFVSSPVQGLSEGPGAPFQRETVVTITDLSPAALLMIDNHVLEHGGDRASASAALLDELAMGRRKAMLAWFKQASPPSKISSVDLIREDRDAR